MVILEQLGSVLSLMWARHSNENEILSGHRLLREWHRHTVLWGSELPWPVVQLELLGRLLSVVWDQPCKVQEQEVSRTRRVRRGIYSESVLCRYFLHRSETTGRNECVGLVGAMFEAL